MSKPAILGRVDLLALCFSVARCSPRTLAVLSCARLLVFLFGIMALVDYNSKAAGATYAAKYGALDEDGYVWVPKSARFMDAVAQAQYQLGEEQADHAAVPIWVLWGLLDGVYEPSGLGLYASDSMIKAHVMGATLKDAEEQGLYDRVGARVEWQSLEAHAYDLARFAAEQRVAGKVVTNLATPF